VTVQNSVEVKVEPPIARSYGMNEAGTRFVVRMSNRFAPAALGAPTVEIRPPSNASWTVAAPALRAALATADATAAVTIPPPGDESIRVPVVVTLNGYRMGQTPMVYAVARYGDEDSKEDGIARRLGAGVGAEVTKDGLCLQPSADAGRTVAFDVDPAFAVSDPARYVSPCWVTLTLEKRGATRLRLEYDAWGSDKPAIAADTPLTATPGPVTLSFLLPDARFLSGSPGGEDLRLTVFGGDACLQKISVAKWNPLYAAD
jgi:hypothetical protein